MNLSQIESIWDSSSIQEAKEYGAGRRFFQNFGAGSPEPCLESTSASGAGIVSLLNLDLNRLPKEFNGIGYAGRWVEEAAGINSTICSGIKKGIPQFVNSPTGLGDGATGLYHRPDNQGLMTFGRYELLYRTSRNDTSGRSIAMVVVFNDGNTCETLCVRAYNYGTGSESQKCDVQFIIWSAYLPDKVAFTEDEKVARDLFLFGVDTVNVKDNREVIERAFLENLELKQVKGQFKSWSKLKGWLSNYRKF